MWIKSFSVLTGIFITTQAFGASIPKAPQSATPSADIDSAPEATPAKEKKNNLKAATKQGQVTSLGTITTEVEGDLTIVTARLNKTPDWKDPVLEEHGTFLQIKLPQTQIPASGEFIDGNGPFLKKLATFQLQGDDGALRLFVNQDAAKAKGDDGALRLFVNQDAAKAKLASTAELLGDRIVVTIDHKKLEQLIAPHNDKNDAATAAEIIAKTTVASDAPAPSDIIASTATNTNNTANTGESFNTNMYGQLAKVAAFCALMFLGLIAAHWSRSKRRGKSGKLFQTDQMEPASMKVLNSITIGQKQKLTLVQVGNQQILLGVGPESINLITTIEPKAKQQNFARALDAANPNAEIRLKSPDEITPAKPQRRPLTAATAPSRAETPVKGNRINIGVGDEGPTQIPAAKRGDDITKILRDRLRNLPPG